MYCPKCGQPQISDEARFCSRCGFQLGIVAELLPTDGVLQNYQFGSEENLSLYRRIVSQVGAKLIFISIVLLPVGFAIALAFDNPAILFPLLGLFMIGLIQISYVLIFGEKKSPVPLPAQSKNLKAADEKLNLPPAQTAPVPILEIRKFDTNEFVSPPSVVDHTTKLLELNDDSDELTKTRG